MSVSANGDRNSYAVALGSLFIFFSAMSFSVYMPFMQSRRDALGCDAFCQGGMTSLRSSLTLAGASLIGRASDHFGRIPMLWLGSMASMLGIAIAATMNTLTGLWISIVPGALLNHNYGVTKALVSNYINDRGGADVDRAGAVGKLGMAIGFCFMAGPLLSTTLTSNFQQALALSFVVTLLSTGILFILPKPLTSSENADAKPASIGLRAFLTLPVLRMHGAQLLMCVRLLMAFAFHMFLPIWQVSVKNRFNFGPKDHAKFMGLVGLSYALSQGLVAKPLIKRMGQDPTKLLLVCILLLGGGRPFAYYTTSLKLVYALYVFMVIALGVMNTAITTACSNLASQDQLGGFIGVLESVESIAGIIGPSLGGLLAKLDGVGDKVALGAVIACYGVAFWLVALFFRKHVVDAGGEDKKQA